MHTLPNGRPLSGGDYRDASRPLRRLLKQYGNGALEDGLRYVAGHPAAQSETIALLSIDKQVSSADMVKSIAYEKGELEQVCFVDPKPQTINPGPNDGSI